MAALCLPMLSTRASAQASFPANITWDLTIYVGITNASDNNGGTTRSAPKATLASAVGVAAWYNKNQDSSAKIIVLNGTYTDLGGQAEASELDPDGLKSGGSSKYFCVEGESAGGVIFDGTNFSTSNSFFLGKLWGGKNIAVRNLNFKNFKVTPLSLGNGFVIRDMDNVLVENCNFTNNDYAARVLDAARRVTIRNCKFNDNLREGLFVAIKNALIENCEFNGNWKNAPTTKSDWGSGGLSFVGRDVQIKNSTFNKNGEHGFRQDHVSENVTFTDCHFIGNKFTGILMETAYGPTTFERCQIRENQGGFKNVGGVLLETAYDVTFKNCDIVDNSKQAFKVVLKNRPISESGDCDELCALGAGDMTLAFGQSLANQKNMNTFPYVRNTRILGSRIVSKDAANSTSQGYLIGRNPNDGDYQAYDDWYIDQFIGAGNTYWNRAGSTNVFEKLGGNAENERQFVNFATWKTLTGSEGAATIDSVSYSASEWKNPNLLSNPGFEANGGATNAPSSWSEWSSVGGVGSGYVESGGRTSSWRGVHYNSIAYNMYTFQNIYNLPSGLYTFRIWINNTTGGQKSLSLWAKKFNGSNANETKSLSLPTTSSGDWKLYELRDINVTSGTVEVGLYTDANAGNRIHFDDAELVKQQ
jgi:hypothetical protein